MGLAGTVNLVRYPDRGPNWYAVFRVRRPGETGRGKLFSRSTGSPDKVQAEPLAALIFTQALAEHLGYALVPIRPDATPIPGLVPAQVPPATKVAQFTPKVVPLNDAIDPLIEDVIALFYGDEKADDGRILNCYMAEKTPGSPHPAEDTARTYRRRLRQLCKLLGVTRHSELRDSYKGLTPERLRKKQIADGAKPDELISDENFVPIVRSAAGVFAAPALAYYEEHGVKIATPFPSLPPVRVKHFEAPAPAFIDALRADAEKELRNDPVRSKDYVLYRLASRLGGRVQELTHIRWCDVTPTGVWIGRRKTKKGRFVQLREHGETDELLDWLASFRTTDDDYVIADGECPIRRKTTGEVKNRCIRVARRLVGWLRAKIAAGGYGHVEQCIHWLRKCVGTQIEREHGALARAAVLGTDVATAAKNDPGVIAAAAALGHAPEVSARHYIARKTPVIRAAS